MGIFRALLYKIILITLIKVDYKALCTKKKIYKKDNKALSRFHSACGFLVLGQFVSADSTLKGLT